MNGKIDPGSKSGMRFGFSSELFDGYLWEKDNVIWISLIISKDPGKGNLRAMFSKITELGYQIKVPTPSAKMESICKMLGFQEGSEYSEEVGRVYFYQSTAPVVVK